MEWNDQLIRYWCNHYAQLQDYELNPFEEVRVFFKEVYVSGQRPFSAPYEDTCDLNWEFDKALEKLGSKKTEFRRLYIDGEGENLTLFKEFVALLMEVSRET